MRRRYQPPRSRPRSFTTPDSKFTSGDTFDNVKKFYLAAIAANGWQTTSTSEKPGEAKWYLAKGTSTGRVEVENEHGALQIKLERNDK